MKVVAPPKYLVFSKVEQYGCDARQVVIVFLLVRGAGRLRRTILTTHITRTLTTDT